MEFMSDLFPALHKTGFPLTGFWILSQLNAVGLPQNVRRCTWWIFLCYVCFNVLKVKQIEKNQSIQID